MVAVVAMETSKREAAKTTKATKAAVGDWAGTDEGLGMDERAEAAEGLEAAGAETVMAGAGAGKGAAAGEGEGAAVAAGEQEGWVEAWEE